MHLVPFWEAVKRTSLKLPELQFPLWSNVAKSISMFFRPLPSWASCKLHSNPNGVKSIRCSWAKVMYLLDLCIREIPVDGCEVFSFGDQNSKQIAPIPPRILLGILSYSSIMTVPQFIRWGIFISKLNSKLGMQFKIRHYLGIYGKLKL